MAINYRNYKTRLLSIFKSFFSNDTLVDSLKSDNNLKKIITKEFTIANTIQDNIKTKTNPFDEFSNKFKKITGSKTISDKANITDNYQIEDDINHLITFVKNMYKIDLEDSKNVVREELVTSEIKEPSNSSFNKTIPAGLISKDISPEMFLQGNAMNTISKKMKTGEIYLFTSKPPLIKILKYISIGILSLLSISSFLIFISCIIVGTVSIDGDSFSATWDGVWFLLIFLYGIASIYSFCKELFFSTEVNGIKRKNDNNIFFFNWIKLSFSIGFLFIFFITYLFIVNGYTTIFNLLLALPKNGANNAACYIWFTSLILSLLSLMLLIIVCMLARIYNPKQDQSKMQELVRGFMDDITNGTKKN